MSIDAAQMIPLEKTDRFSFACHPGVPCFNACCQDLHQALTPEDILRLKEYLDMPSGRFLETFARLHDGPETGLPIVTLRPEPGKGLRCPFLTPEGCRVYPARPVSCRLYPLARALSRCRTTGRLTEHYALLKEPHCRGFEAGPSWSAASWISHQQAADALVLGDRVLALISLKNQHRPGILDIASRHAFRLALYDLDAFRYHIFEKALGEGYPFDPERMEKARHDDWALLEIGYDWIGKSVFGDSGPGLSDGA